MPIEDFYISRSSHWPSGLGDWFGLFDLASLFKKNNQAWSNLHHQEKLWPFWWPLSQGFPCGPADRAADRYPVIKPLCKISRPEYQCDFWKRMAASTVKTILPIKCWATASPRASLLPGQYRILSDSHWLCGVKRRWCGHWCLPGIGTIGLICRCYVKEVYGVEAVPSFVRIVRRMLAFALSYQCHYVQDTSWKCCVKIGLRKASNQLLSWSTHHARARPLYQSKRSKQSWSHRLSSVTSLPWMARYQTLPRALWIEESPARIVFRRRT